MAAFVAGTTSIAEASFVAYAALVVGVTFVAEALSTVDKAPDAAVATGDGDVRSACGDV